MKIDMEEELNFFLNTARDYDESIRIDAFCLKLLKENFLETIYEYVDQEAVNSPVFDDIQTEAYDDGYGFGYEAGYQEGHAAGAAETEEALREDGIL